jgi:acetylornithine deacetylase/succinyl-diaminopimelate desuccinylase-like protein
MIKADKLLRELIALPSVNPAFLPANEKITGERRVAEFLGEIAKRVGLEVSFQNALPGRKNVLVRLKPRNKIGKRILFAPHLDTVPCTDDQLIPRTRNGRIYGRGACDTKGSVASMFAAVCNLARSKDRPTETEIVFAGLVDEENGQSGSRALAASGVTADLAIVGEPTRLQIVTAHKGDLWLRLETRGKSAHGARPELGRNAVHEMAKIVHVLETDYAATLRKRTHFLLGRPTVNVGTIAGGTQANVVPDSCSILVDRRTIPGETERSVWNEIKQLLRKKGLSATLADGRLGPCLPLETEITLPLVGQFMRIVGQHSAMGVDYFCDAAVLAAGGIPSIVFGPGDIAQGHTADEWVSIAQLERAQVLLTRFLLSLP